ncbi:response regulator transcription factor [Salipaludibacillus agaradhaerens]|jgi:two-component system LytT family response regulator|uniref:Response regulator transcription factor n=1 Tax=Salipaludibacillus agaradhaerens TaxID=76935 RepID=A0A9Q4B4R2_SALAG|nr:LytTR family DNA-binding domain-containing protein [Salipaludibacillus agaradhaerens]MCR6098291.1 response regulator transcription factor [Salipaludibacillus agaradhaerens]MCR6116079.1 response regulator transcription factor [Salipaludibacillus agaradhaerens]
MKKISIGVVDDDVLYLEQIKDIFKNNENIEILTYSNSTKLLNQTDLSKLDILLLDINMPIVSGFDIAEYMKENHPHLKIIFMSAYTEYALKGYKYYPEDFITKPVNHLRLKRTIDKIIEEGPDTPFKKIGIRAEGKINLVEVTDILYIEKRGKKCRVYFENNESIDCSEGLSNLEIMLIEHNFYRPHQSYLIPINRIHEIEMDNFMRSYNIKLKGANRHIPVSRTRYKELKKIIKII